MARVASTGWRRGVALAIVLIVAAQPVHAQVAGGHVTAQRDGRPVAGATVSLVNAAGEILTRAVSADDGAFRVRVHATGWYRLHVEHAAFADTVVGPVALRHDRAVGVQVALRPGTFGLDAVRVGDAAPQRAGRSAAILGRDEITAARARRLSGILAPLPAVRLLPGAGTAAPVVVLGESCVPSVLLDGSLVRAGGAAIVGGGVVTGVRVRGSVVPAADHVIDDLATPARLNRVEVYVDTADAPTDVALPAGACGLILLQTLR